MHVKRDVERRLPRSSALAIAACRTRSELVAISDDLRVLIGVAGLVFAFTSALG